MATRLRFEAEPDIPAALFNVETEACVLGAMLIDARRIDQFAELVQAEDFYDPAHAAIFELVQSEHAAGRIANPVTLAPFIEQRADLRTVGGKTYLAQLTGNGAAALVNANFPRQIADLAKRRRLWLEARQLMADIPTSFDQPIEALVDRIDSGLNEALQRNESSTSLTIAASFDRTMKSIADRANGLESRGVQIAGLDDFNALTGGLRIGSSTIVGARPGMGKTGLATAVAKGAARNGHGVLLISLEMNKEELTERAIADLIFDFGNSATFEKVQAGDFSRRDHDRIADARAEIDQWPWVIYDPASLKISRLAMTIRRFKRQMAAKGQKLELVIVDYLGLVRPDDDRASRYEQVSLMSRSIKAIAKECGVAIMMLAQLNRKVEERDDKRPQLSDLRDAGDIEQDADCVLFLFREEYYLERTEPALDDKGRPNWEISMERARDRVEIICAKRRNGRVGKRNCYYFAAHQAIRGSHFMQDIGR